MNRHFEKISFAQFKEVFAEYFKDSDKTLEQIYEEFPLPQRATKKSAGYDIYAPFSFELAPGEEIKIPTGLRVIMQPDEVLMVLPRSGHGFKHYLRLANTVGVIDADYCEADNGGLIYVKIRNESGVNTSVLEFFALTLSILTQILGSILPDDFNAFEVSKALQAKVGKTLKVEAGQGVAQAIFTKYLLVDSDSYSVGDDRIGGFGSTTK